MRGCGGVITRYGAMELWSTVISTGQDGLSHTTPASSLVNKLITNSGPPSVAHNAHGSTLSSVKPQYSFNTFITFSAGSILNVTRKLYFIVPGQPI